jgi:hypothetical protein
VRFTRHAKNSLRQLSLSQSEIEAIVLNPRRVRKGRDGKPQYEGAAQGIWLRVVVALDEPDVIVTIHDRKQ